MEQYLKDSPNGLNFDSEDPTTNQFDGNFPDMDHQDQLPNVTTNNNNNFSLNMEQPFESNIQQDLDQQFPTIPGSEFLSPTGNDQEFSNSLQNEPFLDELDPLNYGGAPQGFINDGSSPNYGGNYGGGNNNLHVGNTAGNLDEMISPNNNQNHGFMDSQYFSPPTKPTMDINALSPQLSANTNVRSIPFQNTNNFDLNSGSYLSPSNHNFMSPASTNFENSLDTLRSPNFGSYLNSPPQYNHGRSISLNLQSSSIPNNINNYLSPPNNNNLNGMQNMQQNVNNGNNNNNGNFGPSTYQPKSNFSELSLDSSNQMGSSAPSNSQFEDHISSKQLSKEDKLRRRREFHNAVERRRRDLIKEKIKELGLLVPPSLLNPQLVAVQTFQKSAQLNNEEISELLSTVKVKESKPNKSTILNKSVDYIIHLQYVLEQQEKAKKKLVEDLKNVESVSIPNSTSTISSFNEPTTRPDDDTNNHNQHNNNFMQDFQNHQNEDNFDPDEFFSEIITGNDQL